MIDKIIFFWIFNNVCIDLRIQIHSFIYLFLIYCFIFIIHLFITLWITIYYHILLSYVYTKRYKVISKVDIISLSNWHLTIISHASNSFVIYEFISVCESEYAKINRLLVVLDYNSEHIQLPLWQQKCRFVVNFIILSTFVNKNPFWWSL